jgi:hypothetical protein
MKLVPNSWGSSKLEEFNRCHVPAGSGKGGQFGDKTQCAIDMHPQRPDSVPLPGYLHSDVLMARRAGIMTTHMQQPEPVRDTTGRVFDPLMRTQFERGEFSFVDNKGFTHKLPVGEIRIWSRGGQYDPYDIIYDTWFNQTKKPKELKPEDLPPEGRAGKEDVLSVYRHEVGHAITRYADNERPGIKDLSKRTIHPALVVAGERVTRDMANEVAAWQFAVAISPAHRVSAKMVHEGIASHAYAMYHAERTRQERAYSQVPRYDQMEWLDRRLRNDPVDPELVAKAAAFADRATKVILRYGRRLRSRGLQMLPPSRPNPYFDKTKRVIPGPGGVGI